MKESSWTIWKSCLQVSLKVDQITHIANGALLRGHDQWSKTAFHSYIGIGFASSQKGSDDPAVVSKDSSKDWSASKAIAMFHVSLAIN